MDEYDPSIPPRVPSEEAGLLWRRLNTQAKAAADLANTAIRRPTVIVTNYRDRSFEKAWSLFDYVVKDPEAPNVPTMRGVMVHQSGKLALYYATEQTKVQPELRAKMMEVQQVYNYTDNIDRPPQATAIVLNPELFPHPSSEVFKAYKTIGNNRLYGLDAIQVGLNDFMATFGVTPTN